MLENDAASPMISSDTGVETAQKAGQLAAQERLKMKRILVIGPGGAGKSTFATRLGEILKLKVIHLDALYWRPGWVEPPKQEWATMVEAALKGEAWIMDGNYSGTLEPRLAACDTVIFLDLPPLTCIWRVVRRAVKYRNQTRPDMANGCQEQLDLEFLLWIWNYRRRTRPKIVRMLSERGESVKVIWLQSSAQVEQYLEQVSNTLQPG